MALINIRKLLYFTAMLVVVWWLAACQREPIATNPSFKLEFSTDTVVFDTVFTNIGSATRSFKVYNRNKGDINISSIRLAGNGNSDYRLNIDGRASNVASDVLIKSKDSIFIFVDVNANPTNSNAPLLNLDSIVFETNGNFQDVKLVSWGQDVHFFNADTLKSSTVFTAEKPYLIYNYLWVYPDVELIIEPGARIHFHDQSWLYVDGRISVLGEVDNPVVFQGDRLEKFYRDKPGQWGGIWLTSNSHSNSINWAIIENCITGVNVYPFAHPDFQTLTITNSIVRNSSYASIDARGAKIEAGSCLFANAREVCLSLAGGEYNFTHCTVANYWGQYISRTGPAALLANFFILQESSGDLAIVEHELDKASFKNSIIYGSQQDELALVSAYYGTPINAPFNYEFINCIVRTSNGLDNPKFINVSSENPLFIDPYKLNFLLQAESPAINAGNAEFALQYPLDLLGYNRTLATHPDVGAYEWNEEQEE